MPNFLAPNQRLNPGQSIVSTNGRFTFIFQNDNNLVLYDKNHPIWATNTVGHRNEPWCILQSDGNLVLYELVAPPPPPDPYKNPGQAPFWASGTNGSGPNVQLVVQDDGNVVIYTTNPRAVWATQTQGK